MLLATNYINEKEESSILEDRVKDALFRINRGLPQEVLEEAYRQIITFNSPLLTENNRHFHKLLTEGMEVTYKEKEAIRTKRAYIVDFEKDNKDNNEFLVVNQFTIVEKEERRPDLIIFINGIPLVVIELKSASDENVGIESAYNQIQTYKKDTPSLFNYNAFCVLSDGINAKAGTITSNEERFMNWRTIDGENIESLDVPQYEVLLRGMFGKERFLDIIQNFLLFQESKEEEKDSYIQKFKPEEGLPTPSGRLGLSAPVGMQKMPALTERRNVIIIADEAHRSQYGLEAKTDTKAGEIKYGYAKYLRDALPNASFIGFTGTPIELETEDEELKKIDDEFEEITEGQEENEKEKNKTKCSRLEAVVGSPNRIKQLAEDIVDHYEEKAKTIDGKALIVCMSRRICVDLYDAIIELRPDWHSDDLDKGKIKIVMTGSAVDEPRLQLHTGGKQRRDTLAKRMKDNADELKIVIVRDMWLTGFDVPSMHTMYIDKPMQGHNLIQTISRVNRVLN